MIARRHDGVDLFNETHLKQLVGFVQHEMQHLGQVDLFVLK